MNKKAFTLVELIVVITILAVLATVAFISFQWYALNARDSTRLADLNSITKVLELYNVKHWKYPNPDAKTNITYSWSTAWTQWVFGISSYSDWSSMSNVPVDPVTGLEYPYSVTSSRQEYQLAAVLENPVSSNLTTTTFAWTQEAQVHVKWNYNGKFLKVRTNTSTYLLWVPSILASDITSVELETILTNERLVYKGYKNLPASFSWSVYNTNPTDGFPFWTWSYVANDLVLFMWDTNDLEIDSTKRVDFLDKLQTSYSGSVIESESDIAELLAVDSSSSSAASNYVATALNNSLKTSIEIIAVTSNTAPTGPITYINNDGSTTTYLADNTNSANRFTLSGPVWWTSTVLDNITWLTWQSNGTIAWYMTWDTAKTYCASLNLWWQDDWRLPDYTELESIVDLNRYNPSIDTTYFTVNNTYYWSSITNIDDTDTVWVIIFDNGGSNSTYKDDSSNVRCVR